MNDADYAAQLVRLLTERAEVAEREGRSSEVERFVLKHGAAYTRIAPGAVTLMKPNACHQNSTTLSLTAGLTYIEGFALVAVPSLSAFDHAWCLDSAGRVCEPTWHHPGLAYFGVAFASEYVARRMSNADEPEHGLLRGPGCGALLDGDEEGWRA